MLPLRNANGMACDFQKLLKGFLEGLCYVVLVLALCGCTVNVDKRSYSSIFLTPTATAWSTMSVSITPSVSNASETQMEQAIDGTLSLPLVP